MSPQKKCNRVAPPPPPRRHQPLISKEKIDSSSLDASVQPIHETCRTKWLQKEEKKKKNGTTGNAPLRPCSGLKPSGYHDNSLIAFKYTPKASGFDPLDPRGCDTALQQVSHKNTPLVWFSEKKPAGFKRAERASTSSCLHPVKGQNSTGAKKTSCKCCKLSFSELFQHEEECWHRKVSPLIGCSNLYR